MEDRNKSLGHLPVPAKDMMNIQATEYSGFSCSEVAKALLYCNLQQRYIILRILAITTTMITLTAIAIVIVTITIVVNNIWQPYVAFVQHS